MQLNTANLDLTTVEKVLAQYEISLKDCTISSLGHGLINTTLLIKSPCKNIVLQRINHKVFPQPTQVIDNADLLYQHLLLQKEQSQFPLTPIEQYKTVEHSNHVKINNEYWRALSYINNSITYEQITNTEQAFDLGKAFATFTSALSQFKSETLHTIIPNFHNLSCRIQALEKSLQNPKKNREEKTLALSEFVFSQQAFIKRVAATTLKVPVRATHNDTKLNNLLFDRLTGKPCAVIDLDTCMPGYLMHDFGDMIRSCCSTSAEDDEQLSNMRIKFNTIKALTSGFYAGFSTPLSAIEKQSLLVGIKLMPFMLGIRFLTDYLNGDKYFQVEHTHHNLVRAKNQLHLYQLFCDHHDLLNDIVLNS